MALLSGFKVSLADVRSLGEAARAAFAGGSVPSAWSVVTPTALGLAAQYQDGNYFKGGSTGASAIVLKNGNDYVVSFRGTDGADDVSRYFELYSGKYIEHFKPLLSALAAQAPAEANFSFTGASLGGGATNLMAKIAATAYGGRFAEAKFVAFASPNIATQSGILNIGYENDPVYKAVGLFKDFSSSLDNLVLATAEYMAGNTTGRNPYSMYAHSSSLGFTAFNRLEQSEFYELMKPDSVVIFDAASGVVQDVTSKRSKTGAFYLGEEVGDHIVGRDGADYIEGFGGADRLSGGKGNDNIRGGAGNDTVEGEVGNDTLGGGTGNDLIAGGAGKDWLTGGTDADLFVFRESGGKNVDTVLDYDFAAGDMLDLSALLDAGFGATSAVADFVRLIASGDDLKVQVDVNGLSGGAKFADVAILADLATPGIDQVLVQFEQQAQVLAA